MLLSTKNLNIKRPKRSLWPKYVGPFEILEPCGKQMYCLKLLSTWQIHDIINISRLEKWRGDKHPYKGLVIIPEEVEFENRQEYEVECVLDHEKDTEVVLHYRVKWVGFNQYLGAGRTFQWHKSKGQSILAGPKEDPLIIPVPTQT